MHFKPLKDRILVKVPKVDNLTKGGIILSTPVKEKNREGYVAAIGTEKEFCVKVGDKILFPSYCGQEIKISDSEDEFFVMKESDVIGVF